MDFLLNFFEIALSADLFHNSLFNKFLVHPFNLFASAKVWSDISECLVVLPCTFHKTVNSLKVRGKVDGYCITERTNLFFPLIDLD